jgi:hypothetical protein
MYNSEGKTSRLQKPHQSKQHIQRDHGQLLSARFIRLDVNKKQHSRAQHGKAGKAGPPLDACQAADSSIRLTSNTAVGSYYVKETGTEHACTVSSELPTTRPHDVWNMFNVLRWRK